MKIKINGKIIEVPGDEIEIEETEKEIVIKVIINNHVVCPSCPTTQPYSQPPAIWYQWHDTFTGL